MPAVVTGCAGFIGFHLATSLLADGVDVIGVDNVNDAYDVRLKAWRIAQLERSGRFRLERRDLARRADLAQVDARGADVVYHLAARAGVRQSMRQPELYLEANAVGTLNVLEWCRANGVRRVLVASTSSVYGDRARVPFREDANTDHPLSPYAASKKAAEAITASYAHLYGLSAPVVRLFTVYGPAGRPELSIFRFVQAVFEGRPVRLNGDGTQTRDFTYVADVVRGARTVADRAEGFEIVNLGGGEPVDLNHVLGLIEREIGRAATVERAPMPPADVTTTWADITKARALGWTPCVAIEEGIRRTVDWYRENREWASQIVTGD